MVMCGSRAAAGFAGDRFSQQRIVGLDPAFTWKSFARGGYVKDRNVPIEYAGRMVNLL
jgi:hypothetical protein